METVKTVLKEKERVRTEAGLEGSLEISVVIPISERHDDLRELYEQYAREVASAGRSHEFIYVIDGPDPGSLEVLKALKKLHPEIKIIALNRWVGEATALSVGFDQARGSVILTLPSYFQVEPREIRRVIEKLEENGNDLVIARRFPRIDSVFNRLQSGVFHWLVQVLTGTFYHDMSCGLRAMKRAVTEEIGLYGDLHRFFPLLADQRGFKVVELAVRQSGRDLRRRIYKPGVYLRRLLDILTLFFLFKFTKKPLRFFGLAGSVLFGIGAVITGYLGLYRLLGFGGIADRPLLVLGVLVMVMGVQLFSIGLLGEIIIFTHDRGAKEYQIREILD